MRTLLRQIFPTLALVCSTAHANLTQPNDGPYVQIRRGHTLYIYDRADRDVIADVVAYNEAFRSSYDRSFRWKLDEEQDLVLVSPRTQDANAFATQYPNIKSFWYGSGPAIQESSAVASWMPLLAAHEVSHLYQMNAKSAVGSALKTVFGNAAYVNPLLVPFVLRPNELLPTSFAEGNAVLNESRVNRGGRLYSGEIRAMVLRLSAGGQIDATRLLNEEFKFPYGVANYNVGGYFQAHLAAKYGIEKTNSFFLAHGQRWLNPFRVNATFRTHFGASFYQEVREFTRGLERLAEQQKVTPGAWISTGVFEQRLNHDADRVWWLAAPGYRAPTLWQINKKTGAVTSERVDLAVGTPYLGKVYFDGTRPRVATTSQNDLHHRTYGIYAENAHLEPEGRGEIVTDLRAGHRVGFAAASAWRDPRVVRDGEFFDIAHSDPILDDQGRTYYFRQSGTERHLYRDRQLVARFPGQYSKLTEVDARGEVYFIGATPFGASLFRFDGLDTTRVLDSDAVIDARRLDDGHFIVEEFDARGVHVVIAAAAPRPEKPAVYVYPFASEDIAVPPALDAAEVRALERPYTAWREMRFGELGLSALYSSYFGTAGTVSASFTDPLEFNDVRVAASYSTFGSRAASAQYTYSRYLPNVYLRQSYNDLLWRSFDGRRRVTETASNLGVTLPVWRHDRWDAKVATSLVYAAEGARYDTERSRTSFGIYSRAQVERRVPTPTGFYPWRYLGLALDHRVRQQSDAGVRPQNAGSVSVKATHGFEGEFYLAAEAQFATSERRALYVGSAGDLLPSTIGVPRLGYALLTPASSAARARVEGRKVLPSLAYDSRLPIGLNRVGLLVTGQGLTLGETGPGQTKTIVEYGYGVDANVLLGHKASTTVRVLMTHADLGAGREAEDQVSLGLTSSF